MAVCDFWSTQEADVNALIEILDPRARVNDSSIGKVNISFKMRNWYSCIFEGVAGFIST